MPELVTVFLPIGVPEEVQQQPIAKSGSMTNALNLYTLWLFGQANDDAVRHEFEQAGSE